MKKLYLLIVILSITGVIFSQMSEIDMIMESMKGKPKKELFKVFHFIHKKSYPLNSQEGLLRYRIFKENLKWIESKNIELGKEVYGITQFIDLTDQEFRAKYLMSKQAMSQSMIELSKNQGVFSEKDLTVTQNEGTFNKNFFESGESVNIDWRGALNPPKDQGSCGSCWAFAAIGSIEGNYNLKFKELKNLSEQYLVDCDDEDGACNGGWPTRTFVWLKQNGLVSQEKAPYKAKEQPCKVSDHLKNRQNLIKDVEYCEKSNNGKNKEKECTREFWINMLKRGPVIVAMDAGDKGFSKYKPTNKFEPWIPPKCEEVNHAVVAVGFITENNEDYIIVRNSWGTTWGFGGYFKVPANKHCGILDFGWLPIVQKDEPFPQPSCQKYFSQCNFSGESVSACEGVRNFNQTIGGKVKSYQPNGKEYSNALLVFPKADCRGEENNLYENLKCDESDDRYKDTEIMSAAKNYFQFKWGCVFFWDQPCTVGNQISLCSSSSDLPSAGVTLSPGSVGIYDNSIKIVVLFDEIKYKGNYMILRKQSYNTDDEPGLNEFLKKTKSIMIVSKKPGEPDD